MSSSTAKPTDAKLLDAAATHEYRSIIGSAMYLAGTTRPDIAYATAYLARSMQTPTDVDMQRARRLLGYIATTLEKGIKYSRLRDPTCIKLESFIDADFARESEDRRSTTGAVHRLESSGAFAWHSQRQKLTSRSIEPPFFFFFSRLLGLQEEVPVPKRRQNK